MSDMEDEEGEFIQDFKRQYIAGLIERGHSEKIATDSYEKLLRDGPRPGSKLYKFFKSYADLANSKKIKR